MSVNVEDLELPQLAEVKKQLDDELTHLTNSFSQLKQAQAKFKACVESAAEIKPANKNNAILVPLTNSLYVPGKLSDVENVIIDVGTGYYVKKSRADATKFYEGRIDFVKKNLDTLQETIQKKQDNLNILIAVMQQKMATQQQQSS